MKLKYFKVQEFVPRHIYTKRGPQAINAMDKDLLNFIDCFRGWLPTIYKGKISVVVNDWLWNKKGNHFRGLRTTRSKYYSQTSMHTFGKALDFDVFVDGALIPASEIRKLIIKNRNLDFMRAIKFIEDGVNWVHVDTRTNYSTDLIVWCVNTEKVTTYRRKA